MNDECPNAANHTPCPGGYIAWHDWAYRKGRRHYPIKCPACRRFSIWKRRAKNQPDYGGREEEWLPSGETQTIPIQR